MRSFRDMPIRRKLTVVILLSASLAVTLAGIVGISYEFFRYHGAITRELTAQSDIMGEACAAALAFDDQKTARETLAALHARPELVSARLFRPDGTLFVEYVRADAPDGRPPVDPPRLDPVFDNVGRLRLCRPVTLAGDFVGTICIRADLREQRARVRTYAMIGGGVLLVSMFLAVFVAQRLQRTISDPLLDLANVMRDVGERGDLSARALKRSEDEIGALTDGFNRMVAQIKQSEDSLRSSEERFRQVTENIHEVFWMTNLDKTQMLYVSRAYEEIWGWPVSSLYTEPRSWSEAIHPEDRDRVRAAVDQQESGKYDQEYRIRRPDGSIRWVRDRAFPVRDATGKVYRIAGLAEDITARKRAEETLRETQEQLQAILDNTTAVIYLKDRDGRYLLINHEFEKLFHVNRQQFIGKTDLDLFPKDKAEVFRANDREVMRAAQPLQFEEVAPQDDGLHTYISIKFPFFDAARKPYAVCGISTDITERKRAEEAIRDSSAKYRLLVENIDEIIYRIRLNGDPMRGAVEYVSPRLATILGYEPEEFVRERAFWLQKVHPEDLPQLKLVTHTILNSGQKGVRLYRFRHGKTGEYRWMEDKVVPMFNDEGKVTGFQGASRDITERKRAEEALQTQARVLESMVEGVLVYDGHERIVFTNPACDAMFGYQRGELIGQSTYVLNPFPPEQCAQIMAEIEEHLATHPSLERQFQNRRKDGSEFISESRISRLQMAGQWCQVAVIQDVTERKRLEREILEISEREQARIGQDLHDGLCQHLYSTGLAATFLQQTLEGLMLPEADDAGKIAELIETAIDQARHLARGLYPVRLEAEGLASALHELAAATTGRCRIPCLAHCDEETVGCNGATAINLFRIAQEAVNNAVRHAGAGRIDIKLFANRGQLNLRVSDNGVGLAADRAHGMGLHIMDYRARMIGGHLEIAPGTSGGTVVTCSIPVTGENS